MLPPPGGGNRVRVMTAKITRRALLGGALGSVASAALAEAPTRSLFPRVRPGAEDPRRPSPLARPTLADLVAEKRLEGTVSIVAAEDSTGRVMEEYDADRRVPAASVTKALTTIYALDALGPDFRFTTRLLTRGSLSEGVLEGDLILSGEGDPTLTTSDLAGLVDQLKAAGVTRVEGDFQVWSGALPYQEEIDPGQLDHLDYNPAIAGLNLNFNRVYFQWEQDGGDYDVTMDARDGGYKPEVTVSTMTVADRRGPVYTYDEEEDSVDAWTVASGALGGGGARWLPVRHPGRYAGEVFRSLCEAEGITLGEATLLDSEPESDGLLAEHRSEPLSDILEEMLLYSTNITAEVIGLTATNTRFGMPETLATSARHMSEWLNERYGTDVSFVDHSGLGDASRVTAREMVTILTSVGADSPVRTLMKTIDIRDEQGRPQPDLGATVHAKTGTLNFVSALAGWETTTRGGHVAFAIFSAELEEREASKDSLDEIPEGSRWYLGRSRQLQQELLNRWAVAAV